MIGWCPQNDALFKLLTVEEHMDLFTSLLVSNSTDPGDSWDPELKNLGLYEHRQKSSSMLSGGLKRRLSLAIAMIGGPDVLLCDESTSGCDVFTRELVRRVLLDYVRQEHGGRSVLASTHYVDDVEVLARRVWFLNERYLVLDNDVEAIRTIESRHHNPLIFTTADLEVKHVLHDWYFSVHGKPSLIAISGKS